MSMEKGYCTTTYRFKLYTKHIDWIKETKRLYNEIMLFYYDILIVNPEWLELSNQRLLRKLELETIGSRNQKDEVLYPLPWEKIPLYFRRAAINGAIGVARSYLAGKHVRRAEAFHASPVYYAGMYRNFNPDSIELKLWNGEKWQWNIYKYQAVGREIPEGATYLSPSLKVMGSMVMLHIPIKQEVDDIRTIKERLEQGEQVAAVYFPDNNNLAVCVLFDRNQQEIGVHFFKGGKELTAKRNHYIGMLKRDVKKLVDKEGKERESYQLIQKKYYKKVKALNNTYAHKISKQIVNYCIENEVKIIIMPKYDTGVDLNKKSYLSANGYTWIGRKIEGDIQYKAFQSGIVTGTVRPHYITRQCSICGEEIKRYNEGYVPSKNYYGGKLFLCKNGHKGNVSLNAARNIGKKFFQLYQEFLFCPSNAIQNTCIVFQI